jgi:hypothetical protein
MLVSVVILLVFLGLIAASEIDGKWKGVLSSQMSELEVVYTFKVVDDSLTGLAHTSMGDAEFLNGKVNGTNFSFDTEWNGSLLYHKCTLQGDSVLMKMPSMGGEEIEVILKKQVEEPSKLKNVKINEN